MKYKSLHQVVENVCLVSDVTSKKTSNQQDIINNMLPLKLLSSKQISH